MTHRIAILGDFNPIYTTHHALNDSIRQIRSHLNEDIQFDWISTDIFNSAVVFKDLYKGLWITPGSPYKDMQNVLNAITYARQNGIPVFGNCGGFQHMIIEFARNVCGISEADHEETKPDAKDLVISKLSCSLVEQEEQLTITDKSSLLFHIMRKEYIPGRYFCSYGMNGKYTELLKEKGLRFTAMSQGGEVRAFELKDHPFFMGTLFQPALTSTMIEPNPLIIQFVKHCLNYDKRVAEV